MPAFLIPLLLNLAPTVASWVLGDKTGKAVDQVAGIIKQTTGLDGDPADALAQNPELALRLKEALIRAESEERQRQHEEVLAQLADVASARNQTVELARAGSAISWGAPIISVIVTAGFFAMLYLVVTREIPDGSQRLADIMLGWLGAAFSAVVGYWVGSSAGSAQKTSLVEALARKQ